MNWIYSALSLLAAVASFGAGNPAVIPVFGLAFGAAGALRESRGARRTSVFCAAGLGCLLCGLRIIVGLTGAGR